MLSFILRWSCYLIPVQRPLLCRLAKATQGSKPVGWKRPFRVFNFTISSKERERPWFWFHISTRSHQRQDGDISQFPSQLQYFTTLCHCVWHWFRFIVKRTEATTIFPLMQNSLFLRGSSKQTLIDKVPEHLLLSVLTFKFDYFNFDRDTAFHQTRLGWIFDYGNSFCLIWTFRLEIIFHCLSWRCLIWTFRLEMIFHCLSWRWE